MLGHEAMGMPMLQLPELLPLVAAGDPLGAEGFANHHLPLAQAPGTYERFQRKEDGFVKVVLRP